MEYRYDIQGIRAIAVLFVFVFHLNSGLLPGGFIGVDIFFVISGFLITTIIQKKIDLGNFSFIDFYKSRIMRIVPAYYAVLLFIAVVAIFLYLNVNIGALRKGLVFAFLFISNNYFSTLDNYFGTSSSENPLLHTWTLSVEMQFYFILPLLLYQFRKISKKNTLTILSVLVCFLIIYSQYEISYLKNLNSSYFSLPVRSWEFLIGSLFAFNTFDFKSKALNNFIGGLGIVLLLLTAFFYNENDPFPGVLALIPCLGTGLIIISKGSFFNKVISNSVFVKLGELSYSIYLWHWPIMAFYRYYYNRYEITLIDSIIIIILTMVLSFFSYHLIENNFRKLGNKKVLTFGGITISILLFLIFFLIKINAKVSIVPSDYASYQPMGLESHGKYYKKDEFLGDLNSVEQTLLIGDSHGLVLKPYLDYLGKRNGFKVQTITNDAYLPIEGLKESMFKEKWRFGIYEKLSKISKMAIKNSKVIFIAKSWYSDDLSVLEGLNNMITSLDSNQKVVFISDFPILDKNPIRVNRGIIKDAKLNSSFKKILPIYPNELKNIILKYPNVYYLDLTKASVFDDIPYYNDTVMYYDDRHINKFGSIKYAENTEKDFMELYSKLR